MKRKFFYKFCFHFVLFFLYLPVFVVAVFAFNESKSRAVFTGFSMKWFFNLINNKIVLEAFLNSLVLAVLASTISLILGVMFAVQISKLTSAKQSIFLNLNYFPIVNSDVTIGVSLMMILQLILQLIKRDMGFYTVLIAHVVICLPYVIFTLFARVKYLSLVQLNAALDLGCTPLSAFFKIILPQMKAELLGAFMIAFSISFDDFTVSYFTAGSSFQTLPILIYSMVRKRITPAINALFAIIFLFALIILILVSGLKLRANSVSFTEGNL